MRDAQRGLQATSRGIAQHEPTALDVADLMKWLERAEHLPRQPLFDGHTLAEQLQQTGTLLQDIGVTPTTVVVDLGFRGVDDEGAPAQTIHRGKFKSLSQTQRRWLKRRQAIEPAIGHAKSVPRMDRCWLAGSTGDALHAVLCAAGYNIRWLLRANAAKGAGSPFLGPQPTGVVCGKHPQAGAGRSSPG